MTATSSAGIPDAPLQSLSPGSVPSSSVPLPVTAVVTSSRSARHTSPTSAPCESASPRGAVIACAASVPRTPASTARRTSGNAPGSRSPDRDTAPRSGRASFMRARAVRADTSVTRSTISEAVRHPCRWDILSGPRPGRDRCSTSPAPTTRAASTMRPTSSASLRNSVSSSSSMWSTPAERPPPLPPEVVPDESVPATTPPTPGRPRAAASRRSRAATSSSPCGPGSPVNVSMVHCPKDHVHLRPAPSTAAGTVDTTASHPRRTLPGAPPRMPHDTPTPPAAPGVGGTADPRGCPDQPCSSPDL